MSEFIITNKTITIALVVFIVIAMIVGVISYNLGVSYGLKQLPGRTTTSANGLTGNQPTAGATPTTNEAATATASDIVISGEPVVTQGTTILNGKVVTLTSNGFSWLVTTEVLNPVTRQISQRTTSYKVIVNNQTKITEQTSLVETPVGLAPPKVTTTTKNLKLADLKPNQAVTVTTNNAASDNTLTALTVTISSIVRK